MVCDRSKACSFVSILKNWLIFLNDFSIIIIMNLYKDLLRYNNYEEHRNSY